MEHRPPLYIESSRLHRLDAHTPVLKSISEGKIDFHAMGMSHYPGDRLRPGLLPGLLSIGFWDAYGEQNWGMEFHRNEGIEICLLETGSMQFAVEESQYQLTPGKLTLTRPWQAHRQGNPHIAAGRLHWAVIKVGALRPDQEWQWPPWVLLSSEDRKELSRRLRFTENPVWDASPEIKHGFARIATAITKEPLAQRISPIAVGLNEILLGFLDMLRMENQQERPGLASREHSIALFLMDLKQNLNNLEENWTLLKMAEACGVGTTVFSQVCRRLTNSSPVRFLNLARLDAAAHLLRADPRRSITDVAFSCGFQSSQYFAYQFARRFGMAPRDYRKMKESNQVAR